MNRLLVLVLAIAVPASASAAGFLFGENGARALSLGGAFAAQADDLTAIQHNPAGLTQVQGYSFLLDGSGLSHHVTFQRRDADGTTVAERVENEGGLFLLPVIGLGYGRELAGRRFNLSFGVYGPPSVGRYVFPEPNYEQVPNERGGSDYVANPIKFSPQRYGLINNDIIILFPSLAAAYEVVPRKLSVGASLQYVYAELRFRQAVTSMFFTPASQRQENPGFDSTVEVHQTGKPTVTGILGVLYRPLDNVAVGASYRPPVKIDAEGTAVIEPGLIAQQVGTVVEGDQATFSMTLPQELKLGVQYRPLSSLGLSAELVYQGWQSVDQFVLTPTNIGIAQGAGEPVPVGPIVIPKGWNHTFSGRFGAEYGFAFGLTARAGVLVEQSAIPDEQFHIDFAHPSRLFVTGGLEYAVGPVDVVLAGAYTPYQTRDIANSQVRQANTNTGDAETGEGRVEGSVIGNGQYVTGGWIATLGIRGSFGAEAMAGPR